MKIGAQLYTAHERFTNLTDFDIGLKKVADMGYKTVQVSGTCPFDPYWLRDELDKYGLECGITHTAAQKILEDPLKVAMDHKVFGCKYIGIGTLPEGIKTYDQFRERFLPAAEVFAEQGVKFMYHNHDFEFVKEDGKHLIQRMVEGFAPELLGITLDIGWADFGGVDVMELIDMLQGRIACVHLKDYADHPEDGSIDTRMYMRPIYEGKLDYDAFIPALEKAGTEFALVEQDWCYDEDEFACLKRSYDHIVSRFPQYK